MQELVHENFDRRIEFCELIETRGNDFANNTVFSDEARSSFELYIIGMLIVRISDIGALKIHIE